MSRNEWPLRAVKFCERLFGKKTKMVDGRLYNNRQADGGEEQGSQCIGNEWFAAW